MSRRIIIGILIAFVVLIAAGAIGFLIWTSNPRPAMPQALDALKSDSQVDVQTDGWLVFRPRASEPFTGFIFYPGGLVDARAYAPPARAIAAQGYLVVIVPMPFNMAVMDMDRAQDVIRAYPNIKRWAIGGHSVGGYAATAFAQNHADSIKGIAIWAAYPAPWDNLSNGNFVVVSISATNDGKNDKAQLAASHNQLPPTTRWVEIQGGNHGQFGYYGIQDGDGVATISREEQQAQIIQATVDMLAKLK